MPCNTKQKAGFIRDVFTPLEKLYYYSSCFNTITRFSYEILAKPFFFDIKFGSLEIII